MSTNQREIQAFGEQLTKDVKRWRSQALELPVPIVGISMAFHINPEDFHYAPTLWGLQHLGNENEVMQTLKNAVDQYRRDHAPQFPVEPDIAVCLPFSRRDSERDWISSVGAAEGMAISHILRLPFPFPSPFFTGYPGLDIPCAILPSRGIPADQIQTMRRWGATFGANRIP
jgi:hypothetical protein